MTDSACYNLLEGLLKSKQRVLAMTSPFRQSVPREEAGSLVLHLPSPSSHSAQGLVAREIVNCGGNTLLMEARLCEITSSIRGLVRSNHELRDALLRGESPDDPDFLQAMEENKIAIRRQGYVAAALVQEMQAHGCNVNLEDDIKEAIVIAEATENAIAVTDPNSNRASVEQQPTGAAQGTTGSATATNDADSPSNSDSNAEAVESSGLYL